jgi:hypothetical protein
MATGLSSHHSTAQHIINNREVNEEEMEKSVPIQRHV